MSFPFFSLPEGVTLKELITAQSGNGPSGKKLQYLLAGRAGVLCASCMSLAGLLVYGITGKADGIYWTAHTALWATVISFSSWTTMNQDKQTKEIVIAQAQASGGTDPIPSGD